MTRIKFHTADLQILGATVKKIIRHGDLTPSICTPLQYAHYAGKNIKFKLLNMQQILSCNACNIKDVSQRSGKTSVVSSPHHNTVKKVHINVRPQTGFKVKPHVHPDSIL